MMNIEEKAANAEDFLNSIMDQVFANKGFAKIYTDTGTLKNDIKGIAADLDTNLQNYLKANEKARRHSGQLFQDNLTKATLDLNAVLLDYQELCIARLFPILKQKLIDLPNKLNEGKIQLGMATSMEPNIPKPPSNFEAKPEVTVPVNPLDDKKVNTFKEKINRALEWIEIPLTIGEKAGEFLSEHGSTIVSAVSGVLKLMAII